MILSHSLCDTHIIKFLLGTVSSCLAVGVQCGLYSEHCINMTVQTVHPGSDEAELCKMAYVTFLWCIEQEESIDSAGAFFSIS